MLAFRLPVLVCFLRISKTKLEEYKIYKFNLFYLLSVDLHRKCVAISIIQGTICVNSNANPIYKQFIASLLMNTETQSFIQGVSSEFSGMFLFY